MRALSAQIYSKITNRVDEMVHTWEQDIELFTEQPLIESTLDFDFFLRILNTFFNPLGALNLFFWILISIVYVRPISEGFI